MPIYEYKCHDCGKITEVLIRTNRQKEVVCSHCGSSEVEKQMSVPGIRIKTQSTAGGHTCCGREERCDSPPCSSGGGCRRD